MQGKVGDQYLVIFGESWTHVLSTDKVSAEHFVSERNQSEYKILKNTYVTDKYEVYTKSQNRISLPIHLYNAQGV